MDAGPARVSIIPMPASDEISIYRNEVTEAAVRAVLSAVNRFMKWVILCRSVRMDRRMPDAAERPSHPLAP